MRIDSLKYRKFPVSKMKMPSQSKEVIRVWVDRKAQINPNKLLLQARYAEERPRTHNKRKLEADWLQQQRLQQVPTPVS